MGKALDMGVDVEDLEAALVIDNFPKTKPDWLLAVEKVSCWEVEG